MRQLQKFMRCSRTLCQEGLGRPCCTSRAEQAFWYNTVTLKWSLLTSAVLVKVLRQAAEVLYVSLRRPRFTSLNCDLSSAGIKQHKYTWRATEVAGLSRGVWGAFRPRGACCWDQHSSSGLGLPRGEGGPSAGSALSGSMQRGVKWSRLHQQASLHWCVPHCTKKPGGRAGHGLKNNSVQSLELCRCKMCAKKRENSVSVLKDRLN